MCENSSFQNNSESEQDLELKYLSFSSCAKCFTLPAFNPVFYFIRNPKSPLALPFSNGSKKKKRERERSI
jgi:hypothetical protein